MENNEDSQENFDFMDLYKVIRQKREEICNPVARVLIASCLIETNADKTQQNDIEEVISEWIKTAQDHYNTSLTGFLLVKGLFLVHLLEGESDILNLFLRYLHEDFNKEKSRYTGINIVTFNEENPERCYGSWLSENVFQTGPPIVDIDKTEQQMIDRTSQIYTLFCNAGSKTLKIKDKGGIKLGADVPLTNEDLYMLLQKRFIGINEYAEIYLGDLEIDIDSEHVFPFTPSLLNYLEFADLGKLTELQEGPEQR